MTIVEALRLQNQIQALSSTPGLRPEEREALNLCADEIVKGAAAKQISVLAMKPVLTEFRRVRGMYGKRYQGTTGK